MPNVTLHLLLAERVLGSWTGRSVAPFPTDEPLFRNAFLQGAFGPDLGYFPGGERRFSDLAHCVGSGTLTRTLLARARTPVERAFAWGWVTHVVADRHLHPVVGLGLGDFRGTLEAGGTGPAFVSADADPAGHVRVETGIDAWISSLHPALRRRRFAPVFDELSIRFVGDAYRDVYGLEVELGRLLASHLATVDMSMKALSAIGVLSMGTEWPTSRLGQATVALAGRAARTLGRGEMTLAFLSPVPPPAWLRIAVAEEVAAFTGRVDQVLDDPDGALPDVNLDTGRPDGTDPDHGVTLRTLKLLEA